MMAAKDGDGSDVKTDTIWCHICAEVDLQNSAQHFCQTCKQCLCLDCRDLHRIIKTTKSHEVLSFIELPITLMNNLNDQEVSDESQRESSACDICTERGQDVCAEFRCVTCEQCLCDACKQYHMRARATKLHEIYILPLHKTSDSKESHPGQSSAGKTLTCAQHDGPYTTFCVEHWLPLCAACKLEEHENCKEILDLEAAAERFKPEILATSENFSKLLNENEDTFRVQKDVLKAREILLSTERQKLLSKLKNLRSAFDSLLDKLQVQAQAELDMLFDAKLKHITDAIFHTDSYIVWLQKTVRKFQQAASNPDDIARLVESSIIAMDSEKAMSDTQKDLFQEDQYQAEGFDHKNLVNDFQKCKSILNEMIEFNVSVNLSFEKDNSSRLNASLSGKMKDGQELPEILSTALLKDAKKDVFGIIEAIVDYGFFFHTVCLS